MDSGTTLLRLPQKVFNAVVEAVARMSLVSSQDTGASQRARGHDPARGSVTMDSDCLHLVIWKDCCFFKNYYPLSSRSYSLISKQFLHFKPRGFGAEGAMRFHISENSVVGVVLFLI